MAGTRISGSYNIGNIVNNMQDAFMPVSTSYEVVDNSELTGNLTNSRLRINIPAGVTCTLNLEITNSTVTCLGGGKLMNCSRMSGSSVTLNGHPIHSSSAPAAERGSVVANLHGATIGSGASRLDFYDDVKI